MLLSKLSLYPALIALAASFALGDSSAAQAVTGINGFTSSLQKTNQALKEYVDGQATGITVIRKFEDAHREAKAATNSVQNSGLLSGAEEQILINAYMNLHPEVLNTLNSVTEKAPAMKITTGIGYVARTLVSDFNNEKDDLHNAMKEKISEEQYREMSPSMESLDSAFKRTERALAA